MVDWKEFANWKDLRTKIMWTSPVWVPGLILFLAPNKLLLKNLGQEEKGIAVS